MIFISLGTDKYQFNRLLQIIDDAIEKKEIEDSVFAQTGESDYIPKHFSYKNYLSFSKISNYLEHSDIIILHAGVGSTLLTLSLGKIPILFPRLKSFGEHIDDHQLEFIKKIESANRCIVAYDAATLLDKINRYETLASEIARMHATKSNKIAEYLLHTYPPNV